MNDEASGITTSTAIVLFDIDGTLLRSGGATTRCIHRAAEAIFGDRYRPSPIVPGTLDGDIYRALTAACGIDSTEAARRFDVYKAKYLDELERDLTQTRDRVITLPGVRQILETIAARPDAVLGLLTGNFRRGADLKLAAAGLDFGAFAIGAFAEDGIDRAGLVGAALEAYSRRFARRAQPANAILIGDTPRDIACAREAGCKVLSVATGSYSADQLSALRPDAMVSDLTDPKPLLGLIEAVARQEN